MVSTSASNRLVKGVSRSPVYWPAVLLTLIFEPLEEELKLCLVVLGLVVLAIRQKGDLLLSLPKYSSLLIFIVVCGFASGCVNGRLDTFGVYYFLRDFAYFLSPFFLWIFGNAMGKNIASFERLWTTLFFMSIASAASMIVVGIANNGFNLTLGNFKANEFTLFALVLLLIPPKKWVWREEHKKLSNMLAVFDAIALVLSLSRTTFICLVLVLIIMAMRSFSHFFKTFAVSLMCVGFALALFSLMPSSTISTFTDKIANSLSEVNSNKEIWTPETITHNWRGYEKYRATKVFENSGSFVKLFGNGFGYQLDMGGFAYLVSAGATGIPFLHNGYYSILFKCGALSLCALLLFYVLQLIKLCRIWFRNGRYVDGLSAGMLACLVICSYVIEGLFIPSGMYYFTLPLALMSGLLLSQKSDDTLSRVYRVNSNQFD